MTSIEDIVGHEYKNGGNGSEKEESQVASDLGNDKDKKKNHRAKQQYIAYKYSNKGKYALHEVVILAGRPVFLKYEEVSERRYQRLTIVIFLKRKLSLFLLPIVMHMPLMAIPQII